MRYRILDLETCGHDQAGSWLDPVKAPANYKDLVKIADYIRDETMERNNKLGLDIDCCRIVALGWHDVGGADPTVHLAKDEFEEREGLKLFWERFNHRLVTFNGIRFDLPVLVMRSLDLNVPHPELTFAPAWKSSHIDLWERLSLGGARKDVKSLAFYCRKYGFGTLDKVNGADIARLVAEDTPESWQAVYDHCLSDIGLTHALANKLGIL